MCKASRKKKAKVDPTKCLTNAAAAPAEAVEVKLLNNSAGFASALEKGASTRSQDKRVRRQVANMGDQDWVDRVLKEERPSVQHLVGRRDRAYNEAWWKEYKRLEGVKAGRLREMLQAMESGVSWGERRSPRQPMPVVSAGANKEDRGILIDRIKITDLYEVEWATQEDADAEAAPEPDAHVLTAKKRRRFVQLVFESMGIPPEFYHDGDLCWDGTGGAVDRIQQYLPFSMDRRVIKDVMIRTWEVTPPSPRLWGQDHPWRIP